ncbi:BTB/POZ domain-containing protein KCTD12 [Amphibalanus amphitrite]|uniref:BTB/POZ domain-containing protein KCTD12 n=1 Tax=Amphibalanus amphitrite TaxID=1232801 RepID=A0A6A4VXW5_AMPAM|nr:BTB/POZ domain-containing protein KCTD12 [Amphibalanus amphitrite]
MAPFPAVVDLNIGGVCYTTALSTLTSCPGSLLAQLFTDGSDPPPQDCRGRYFIDRDGVLFRYAFGETLNESRDPDRGHVDRYTGRFFLKHSFLEQAFDMLCEAGFRMVGSCGSSTAGIPGINDKPGSDSEENRWNHYNEFVFVRD